MLQKSPQGIQNKPRGTLVRPHYDLIFRLNLVVEFSILCSTVGGQPRPGGYDPDQALPLSNCEIINSCKKARRENLPPPRSR